MKESSLEGSSPATTAMVVGREAAHIPSRFNVFSSIPPAEGYTEENEEGADCYTCTVIEWWTYTCTNSHVALVICL